MDIAVDVETRGLDATKFLMGCVYISKNKNLIFYDKKEMWNYIIGKGYRLAKHNKMLTVHGFNHYYDFAAYADLANPNIKGFCEHPFIFAYMGKEKTATFKNEEQLDRFLEKTTHVKSVDRDNLTVEYLGEMIKFVDTYSVFPMSLKRVGDIVGIPKMDIPDKLLTGADMTPFELKMIEPYNIRDCEIVMAALKYIKKKIRNDGLHIKRIYTISQLAMAYMINKLKKADIDHDAIFMNKDKGWVHWTRYSDRLHSSYRGGMIDAFKTGYFDEVNYVDCNGLYPYCLSKIDFPDLRTERIVFEPLNMFLNRTINKIGLTRALVYNKNCDFGFLQSRTPTGNYYPKSGRYMIGTWTHMELRKALQLGYKILENRWTIKFEPTKNPFTNIVNELYAKRFNPSDDFDDFFYKAILNNSIGKFAQRRPSSEFVIDSVELAEQYRADNWEIVKGAGLKYMYKRSERPKNQKYKFIKKPYYAPIISSLVNAYGRCYMYDAYSLLNPNQLLFTNTDSLIFEGSGLAKFDIGSKLGQFKIVKSGSDARIWGRTAKRVGSDMSVSSVHKSDLNMTDFEAGRLKVRKMRTLSTTTKLEDVGSFRIEERDLIQQEQNLHKMKSALHDQKAYIDADLFLRDKDGKMTIHKDCHRLLEVLKERL